MLFELNKLEILPNLMYCAFALKHQVREDHEDNSIFIGNNIVWIYVTWINGEICHTIDKYFTIKKAQGPF